MVMRVSFVQFRYLIEICESERLMSEIHGSSEIQRLVAMSARKRRNSSAVWYCLAGRPHHSLCMRPRQLYVQSV